MPMKMFLLRLWSADEEPAAAELHGVLESGAPRKLHPFRDEAELLSLLKAGLRREDSEEMTEPTRPAGVHQQQTRRPKS
jgi:hypothetical protein